VSGEVIKQAADTEAGRTLLALAKSGGARRRWTPSASTRVAILAALAIVVATLASAIGYGIAMHSDERQWSEQRDAVRDAVNEFRQLFDKPGAIDPRFVRVVEQTARLKGLRFETDPPLGDREMQPVLDGQGRIAGFFTWDKTYPMTQMMNRLLPLIVGVSVILVGFAGFALMQLARARRDMTESQELARRAADEDKLTGLPNRRRVLVLLKEAMTARNGRKPLTFALFELSALHEIDEEIGMIRREEFLADAVMNTKAYLPANATLGRMGTTEFAVICDGEVEARTMLRAMIRAIGDTQRSDTEVRIGACAGYAEAGHDVSESEELVRRARLALRAAAEKGTGIVTAFDPSLDALSKDQHFLRRELPRAIAGDTLDLHYQPIVASNGARIVGVEALLRWTHPQRGAIGPALFVPVAERMGLIDRLGAFVLRRALKDAKSWPDDLYVAVNLSPLQVRDRTIVEIVRSALEETGVSPSRLMLEITEGVLIDNPEEMLKRIEDLHRLGVRIALDDFGSGYSNLGYLQRFPLDKLKIDRSFVTALGKSSNGGVIIQAIVALGRALGLSVLAEGVETEEQRVLLRLAGCDEMQGFLFAKPAPSKSIERLLRQNKSMRGHAETMTG